MAPQGDDVVLGPIDIRTYLRPPMLALNRMVAETIGYRQCQYAPRSEGRRDDGSIRKSQQADRLIFRDAFMTCNHVHWSLDVVPHLSD